MLAQMMTRIVVGMSGSSCAIYGVRLLEVLRGAGPQLLELLGFGHASSSLNPCLHEG